MNHKPIDFDKLVGEVPEAFSSRIEMTLANLKEEKNVNRRITYRTLLIAALITLLTLGTALAAASGTGLINFFRKISNMEPQEGAENTIARDLGQIETGAAILSVREAVYDGAAARVVLAVEPKEKDKYVLVPANEDNETVMNAETGETVKDYAARTGRETLAADFVDVACVNADVFGSARAACYDGEVLLLYCEYTLGGETPQGLEMRASLEDWANEGGVDLNFTLSKVETVDRAYQVEDGAMEEITIHEATRRDTPFSSNLTYIYSSTAAGEALTWDKVDMTVYAAANGMYFHLQADCSGLQGASAMKSKEAVALGKTPCASCAGRYPWESEECKVFINGAGNFFHLDADCSGMQNAQAWPAREVLEKGKIACPICVGGTVQSTEERWLLKGGSCALEFTTENFPGGVYSFHVSEGRNYTVKSGDIRTADGGRTPFVTLSVQAGLLGEGELTLTRLDANGAEIGAARLIPVD